jgi:hypothetical protein
MMSQPMHRIVLCGGVQRPCEEIGCELWVQKPTSRRWLCKRHKQAHWQAHYRADQARVKQLTDAAEMLAAAAGAAHYPAAVPAAAAAAAAASPAPRSLPAYVDDARVCLAERGFGFVPQFAESRAFAQRFLERTILTCRQPQPIQGGATQFLMPGLQAHPSAKSSKAKKKQQPPQPRAAAAGAAVPSSSDAAAAWAELREEWHQLVLQLAARLGVDVASVQYHVQDEKVSPPVHSCR